MAEDANTPTTSQVLGALHEAGIDTAPAIRWLAAHDAEVKAEAWDEGYQACRTRPSIDGYRINRTNPYRTEAPHV